jgi:hypothetical protein
VADVRVEREMRFGPLWGDRVAKRQTSSLSLRLAEREVCGNACVGVCGQHRQISPLGVAPKRVTRDSVTHFLTSSLSITRFTNVE